MIDVPVYEFGSDYSDTGNPIPYGNTKLVTPVPYGTTKPVTPIPYGNTNPVTPEPYGTTKPHYIHMTHQPTKTQNPMD